jgi:hypothetical protein
MATIDDDFKGYTVKAGDLRNHWGERLRIYEEGAVIVSPSRLDAAKALVQRLRQLDKDEELHVSIKGRQDPYVVRRLSSDEVLAEIPHL